jgi:hypothetical protein
MSERKNIENLFQEKFKNFEALPEEHVWENIEIILKEKKEKRRVIPFWWKFSGIAAIMVLGGFLYAIFNNNGLKTDENVVTKPKIENSKSDINAIDSNAIVNSESNNNVKEDENLKSKSANSTIYSTTKSVVSSDGNSENETNNNKVSRLKNNKKSGGILNKENSNSKSASTGIASTKSENEKVKSVINKTNSIADANAKISTNTSALDNKITSDKRAANDSTIQQVENYNELNSDKSKTTIATVDKQNNSTITNQTNTNSVIKTKSELVAKEIDTKIDSTKLAVVEPNALEKLLNEKEKKITIEEPKLNRWQLSPNVAPIYFSSTANGSPLDAKLENNDKNYAANYSYGIGVNYAVNKKLKVRTGVNRMSVDYDTNGILYYQSSSVNSKISNLNPNVPGSLIIIESLKNVNSQFSKFQQKYEGTLNQKMGYIEVPLELSYKIIDKKIGIDIIGGMSTLFLNQNEIFLQSNELNLKIGEANNLNSIHFSGNIGLGFKYGFLKKMEARIEPVFKYQMNTFSNDVGNFKPYVFGVYSGISYTF